VFGLATTWNTTMAQQFNRQRELQVQLNAFLQRKDGDDHDHDARRAIAVFGKLGKQHQQAYVLGLPDAVTACEIAMQAAFEAFCIVNASKQYPFAALIHPQAEQLSQQLRTLVDPDNHRSVRLTRAEDTFEVLSEFVHPVPTVTGVHSVQILWGVHALVAFHDLNPANAA
jgi:hypothetical protein